MPLMLPPPLTILQDPPEGVAVKVFVLVSQMDNVLVVLLAGVLSITVNVLSLVVAGQAPLAGIVYLTVTFVLEAIEGEV